MKPQIYNLDTSFNFGKHKGKTLLEVIKGYESRYIGYLIFNDVPWFILNPETIDFLEKKGFFDDLHMSYYGDGGSFSLSGIGFKKEDILQLLKKKYNDYIRNPSEYERIAKESFREYLEKKRSNDNERESLSQDSYINDDSEIRGPIQMGSSQDPNENPWLGILPDDEAEDAYWNTFG